MKMSLEEWLRNIRDYERAGTISDQEIHEMIDLANPFKNSIASPSAPVPKQLTFKEKGSATPMATKTSTSTLLAIPSRTICLATYLQK